MDTASFKSMLKNSKGQLGGLAEIVITIVVVAIMAIVGISIFNQANRAALAPTNSGQALLDLTPLVIASIVVIGGVASLLYLFRGNL